MLGVVLVAWTAAPSDVSIIGGSLVAPSTTDQASAPGSSQTSSAGQALIGPGGDVIVDVEGAVEQPGLHRLPAGARVGDAIAAAGGFDAHVDASAAAGELNLATPLTDGAKIHVPALGESAAPATAAAPGGAATPGPDGQSPGAAALIDLNAADETQLETLPGIGPVTGAAIVAARQTAPFTTVDDLRTRGIVGQSTFDKIKALVTVGG